jgi:hypothetical protein
LTSNSRLLFQRRQRAPRLPSCCCGSLSTFGGTPGCRVRGKGRRVRAGGEGRQRRQDSSLVVLRPCGCGSGEPRFRASERLVHMLSRLPRRRECRGGQVSFLALSWTAHRSLGRCAERESCLAHTGSAQPRAALNRFWLPKNIYTGVHYSELDGQKLDGTSCGRAPGEASNSRLGEPRPQGPKTDWR